MRSHALLQDSEIKAIAAETGKPKRKTEIELEIVFIYAVFLPCNSFRSSASLDTSSLVLSMPLSLPYTSFFSSLRNCHSQHFTSLTQHTCALDNKHWYKYRVITNSNLKVR
jgi:hypothetical protein